MLGTSWAHGLGQTRLWLGARGSRVLGPVLQGWGEGVLLSLGNYRAGGPSRASLLSRGVACKWEVVFLPRLLPAGWATRKSPEPGGPQPWQPLHKPQAEHGAHAIADPGQPSGQRVALPGWS